MLKCSLCGTEEQTNFSDARKNRYKGTKNTVLNWCKDCLKQKDITRREKNKLNQDLTRIVTCPKCGKRGDYSSGYFMKSRYLFSKETCTCRECRKTPQFKIRRNQAKRIRECVRDHLKFKKKYQSTMKVIGCTPDELIKYLEDRFKEGMTWDNYGIYWCIDHVKPLASFDLDDYEQVKLCFHYLNLQPLTIKENLEKSDKI